MKNNKPETIEEYIKAAAPKGQPHLRQIYSILKGVSPDAEETIKWGTPFFIEPRYLYSFSAHKSHCNFAPSEDVLNAFESEIAGYPTTKNFLQIPYDLPVPEKLIKRMAEYRVKIVRERDDTSFW